MKMADGASFIVSPEQTLSTASRLSKKEVDWCLCFDCGINKLKSVALIKSFARNGW